MSKVRIGINSINIVGKLLMSCISSSRFVGAMRIQRPQFIISYAFRLPHNAIVMCVDDCRRDRVELIKLRYVDFDCARLRCIEDLLIDCYHFCLGNIYSI